METSEKACGNVRETTDSSAAPTEQWMREKCKCGHTKHWHSLESTQWVPAASGCLAGCNCKCFSSAVPKPPSPQEFPKETIELYRLEKLATRTKVFPQGNAVTDGGIRNCDFYEEHQLANELLAWRKWNAARMAPSCEKEMREIADAAIATRIHGSDYRNGTHATVLWKLVDAVLSKATGEVK